MQCRIRGGLIIALIVILLVIELSKPLEVKPIIVENSKGVSSAVSTKKIEDDLDMKAVIDKAAKEAARKTDEHFKDWENNFLEDIKKDVESFKIKE